MSHLKKNQDPAWDNARVVNKHINVRDNDLYTQNSQGDSTHYIAIWHRTHKRTKKYPHSCCPVLFSVCVSNSVIAMQWWCDFYTGIVWAFPLLKWAHCSHMYIVKYYSSSIVHIQVFSHHHLYLKKAICGQNVVVSMYN